MPYLDRLLSHGDLFIGEVHGTVESPRLMQCLVERALPRVNETVIVSLELSERARDSGSLHWRDIRDGRSSAAMWSLLEFLVQKEREGALRLHFQHGGQVPAGMSIDEYSGMALKTLVKEGFVIALAGNFHSSRAIEPRRPGIAPAGTYVGSDITHIRIESVEAGEAWFCSSDPPCRVRPMPGTSIKNASAGELVDGSEMNHDLIFFVQKYTASMPLHGD